MTVPDLSPDLADWIIGVVVGGYLLLACGGLWWAACRGRWRRLLRVASWAFLLCAAELVAVASLLRRGGLGFALGSAGLVGVVALGMGGPRLREIDDEAEARRLSAQDCL